MKKILIVALVMSIFIPIYARPHRGDRYGCRPWPPPPPGRYYHCGPNNGVRLAADIVGLVGASLWVLNPPRQTTVIQQVPQPVIIQQPQVQMKPVWIQTVGPDGRVTYQKIFVQEQVSPSQVIYY